MEDTILGNFVILREICRYLQPRHLFCCVQVSKGWNAVFISQLWRNIDFKWKINANSLLRHQHYVNTIASFDAEFSPRIPENLRLPNLRKIVAGTFHEIPYEVNLSSEDFLSRSLKILFFAKHVNTLVLSIPIVTKKAVGSLIDSLGRFSSLKTLILNLMSPITLDQLQQIVSNCKQCTVFHLTVTLDDEGLSNVQIEQYKASVRNLEDVKFEDLRIYTQKTDNDIGIVVPILEQSLRVESFYLCYPYSLETLQQISFILQENRRCPLKHLAIDGFQKNELQHEYCEVIRRLFESIHKHYGSAIPITLHFNERSALYRKEIIVQMASVEIFPLYFSNTLTSLILSSTPVDTFVLLLSHLSALRNLRAFVRALPLGEYNYLEEIGGIIWPCLNMRVFDIRLTFRSSVSECRSKVLTILYRNMGLLHNLEELALSANFPVLIDSMISNTPETCCLYHLKDLKKVYKFRLGHYLYHGCKLSIEDIRWMVQHWEGLHQLIIIPDRIGASDMRGILDIVDKHDIIFNLPF